MSGFDPYLKWLGIRDPERPPNHYRLLGLEEFESDTEVISAAADRQMAHVRSFQHGKYADLSQKLLSELALARRNLMSAKRKQEYDQRLRLKRQESRDSIPSALPVETSGADPSPAATATAPEQATVAESKPEFLIKSEPISIDRTRRAKKSSVAIVFVAVTVLGIAGSGIAAFFILNKAGNQDDPSIAFNDDQDPTNGVAISPNLSDKENPQKKDNPKKISDADSKRPSKNKPKNKRAESAKGETTIKPPWDKPAYYPQTLPSEFTAAGRELDVQLQPVYYALALRNPDMATQLLDKIQEHPRFGQKQDDPAFKKAIRKVNEIKRFWDRYELALAGLKVGQRLTFRNQTLIIKKVDGTEHWINVEFGGQSKRMPSLPSQVDRDFAIAMVRNSLGRPGNLPQFAMTFLSFDSAQRPQRLNRKIDFHQVLSDLSKIDGESSLPNANPKLVEQAKLNSTRPFGDPGSIPSDHPKLPVPDPVTTRVALVEIKKVYQQWYRDSDPERQTQLAELLVKDAGADKTSSDQQYTMLLEAAEIYSDQILPVKFVQVWEKINRNFEVEFDRAVGEGLERILRQSKKSRDREKVARTMLVAARSAAFRENYRIAERLMNSLSRILKDFGDPASHALLKNELAEVAERSRMKRGWELAQNRNATDDEDENPSSNLAKGRYLCWIKQEFEKGLPLLAQGSDPRLRKAAELDLKAQRHPEEVKPNQVGQAWLDLATDDGFESTRVKHRAALWLKKSAEDPSQPGGQAKLEQVKQLTQPIPRLSPNEVSCFGRLKFLDGKSWQINWAGYERWDNARFTPEGRLSYLFRGQRREAVWKLTEKGIHVERKLILLLLIPESENRMITERYTIRGQQLRKQPSGSATAIPGN